MDVYFIIKETLLVNHNDISGGFFIKFSFLLGISTDPRQVRILIKHLSFLQILECYSSFWSIFSSESCYISRHTCCKYSRIGCPWQGPFHELASHEQSCIHPNKSGDDIMNALSLVDKQKEEELRVYSNLYCLLSYEKVTFNGNSEL